ncbi:hypothetical protein [Pseudomonas sp. S2_E02]
MNLSELKKLVQARIDEKANIILDEKVVNDGAAFGELQIYFCLRRILNKKATLEDFGVLHAVSDLLQATGVISANQTLGSRVVP